MAYGTGTQGATATPSATAHAWVCSILEANGWSLVEGYTSGTWHWHIYKSDADDNGSVDFYLGVGKYGDADAQVYFNLGEAYDVGTHKFTRYVPSQSNTVPDADGDYCVDDAVGLLPESTNLYKPDVTLSASGWTYWYSVNAKRAVFGFRYSSTETSVYAGLMENNLDEVALPSSAVALGLVARTRSSKSTYPSTAYAGFTREPGITDANSGNWGASIEYGDCMAWPAVTGSISYDCAYASGHFAGRVAVSGSRDGSWFPRAFLLDAIAVPKVRSVCSSGDTVTIGAKTYVAIRSSASSNAIFYDDSV